MKIIEYTTVRDEAVDDCLKKGWQPYGNPMYVARTDEIIQAMVKYEEEAIVNQSHPIIPSDQVLEDYHKEKVIQDEIHKRLKSYQKYWNREKNKFEIKFDEQAEWICTQEELLAEVGRSVRWEMSE